MPLVIVESVVKISKISKILGPDFEVMSSYGHIMDLSKKGGMGIDFDNWDVTYDVSPSKKDVVKDLKAAGKRHDEIYIATDDDPEGHCIAHNLRSILQKKKGGPDIYRSIFKTITKGDILKGIKSPIPFDEKAYDSQKVRRMIDRIVGFKVSPILWSRGLRGASAGRVQTCALKLIIDRELSIRSFVPDEYWSIKADTDEGFIADFYGINGKKYIPKNEKEVLDITSDITGDLTVTGYKKKDRVRNPVAPYKTASMQRDVGTKLGWSSKRVMDTAQRIFGLGLISYHRTDSTRMEPGKIIDLRAMIKDKYGDEYLSESVNDYGQSDDSAHEGIRPTFEPTPSNLASEDLKLLNLIKNRFIASQMAPAVFEQAAIQMEHAGKTSKRYEFRVSGSVMKFDGFLKVYGGSSKDVALNPISKGQAVPINKMIKEQHFTKPTARFTEPTFVHHLDVINVGRPSTYAATIETLIKRRYIVRDKKALRGTEVGIMVCQYLEKNFNSLTSPEFTSDLIMKVEKIASGSSDLQPVMNEFYKGLSSDIDKASKDKSRDLFITDEACPNCKSEGRDSRLMKKMGADNVFYGCESWTRTNAICDYTHSLGPDGEIITRKALASNLPPCPNCEGQLESKTGRFGAWTACMDQLTCKFRASIDKDGNIVEKKKAVTTKHTCLNEGCNGKLLIRERRKDKGEFLGCSKYPKCKGAFSISEEDGSPIPKTKGKFKKGAKAVDTGKKCSEKGCDGTMLKRKSKTGGGFWAGCSNFRKGCKFTEKLS